MHPALARRKAVLSYLVFARKYRPQIFTDVSGQEPVITTLRNAIRSGRIAHAFLFAGPRGVGKTTTARLLAKALNCGGGPTPDPCGKCDSCQEIADGHALDVIEIDGASNRGIDDVKALRESVQYNPARDRHKVVIIDEVHMLSTPAFNALLKTLEEPPAHAKFIFATTEIHKVPATILSRCQVYEFRRISFHQTIERLRAILDAEGIAATDGALALVARHADGCLRDAQSALDQVVAFGAPELTEDLVRSVLRLIGTEVLFEVMDAILAEDGARVLQQIDQLVDRGTDLRQFSGRLAEHIRNLLVARLSDNPGPLVALTESDLARLATQAAGISDDEALRLLNLLASGEEELKHTTAPRFTVERTLLKLTRARRLTPLTDLVAAIRSGAPLPAIEMPAAPLPRMTARTIDAPPRSPVPDSPPVRSESAPAAPTSPPPSAQPEAARPEPDSPPAPSEREAGPAAPRKASTTKTALAAVTTSAPAVASHAAPGAERESAPAAASEPPPVAAKETVPAPTKKAPRAAAEVAPAATDGAARARARKRAESDPVLLKISDLFKGEIIDVNEPGSSGRPADRGGDQP